MKLLLTSGGITNRSISNALKVLLPQPVEKSRIAFIPTASNVENGNKNWLLRDFKNSYSVGFDTFDIVDISAIPMDIWLPRLQQADVIFVGGGNTFHLMYCMRKSGFDKVIPKLLKTKIYVGISAGSISASKSLEFSKADRLYSPTIGERKDTKGLGLVKFHIQPHLNSKLFTSIRLEKIEKQAKVLEESVYAIDDNSAIQIIDSKISVVSEGVWKKFN